MDRYRDVYSGSWYKNNILVPFIYLFIEKCTSSLFRNNILVHMDHNTENQGKDVFIIVEKHWSTILEKGIDQLTDA